MPQIKPVDYTGLITDLSKSLNSLPEIVEKFEKTVINIKTVSSLFTDNKNQLLYIEEQTKAEIEKYENNLKSKSLEYLTEEVKKFDRIVVHKNILTDLEEKNSKLQKYIDSELEKEKKVLEEKYNKDLEDKMQICKILAEKDKIKYEAQLEIKNYKINLLEKIVQKSEDKLLENNNE